MTYEGLYKRILLKLSRTDGVAVLAAREAVNTGIQLAALAYEPSELRIEGTLTTATDGQALDLSSVLTRFLRMERVYNATGKNNVFPLSFEELEMLWLPTTGCVQYYALFGNNFYYKPYPTSAETLNVSYLQYPASLEEDSDEFPYTESLVDFVLTTGTAFAQASIDEKSTIQTWVELAGQLGLSQAAMTKTRKYLREEIGSGELQGVGE
jgi:hypothetical protein